MIWAFTKEIWFLYARAGRDGTNYTPASARQSTKCNLFGLASTFGVPLAPVVPEKSYVEVWVFDLGFV